MERFSVKYFFLTLVLYLSVPYLSTTILLLLPLTHHFNIDILVNKRRVATVPSSSATNKLDKLSKTVKQFCCCVESRANAIAQLGCLFAV